MNMKRRMLLVSAAMLLAGASTIQAAEQRVVKLATDGTYAPFNYTDPAGKLIGFEADLVDDIATFFDFSRRYFFAATQPADCDNGELLAGLERLVRRCRKRELNA